MTIERLIQAHNRELLGEAVVAVGVGIVSIIVVYGVVFFLSWWLATLWLGFFDAWNLPVAFAITGLFLLVAAWSAWRRVDPMKHVKIDLSPETEAVKDVEDALGFHYGVPLVRRESVAGFGVILIGGPANLFDAVSLWRSRLRVDRAMLETARRTLELASRQTPLPAVADRRAIPLLRLLGLIKVRPAGSDQLSLDLTEKGWRTFRA